jgi:hypothetical protein
LAPAVESTDDALTLAALGVLALVLAVVSHEGLGHGLATLAVGAKPVILTSCYFGSAGIDSKWIPAAGGIANVAIGLLSLVILRSLPKPFSATSPHLRYFLILAIAFNLFFASGYPAYSGIALFGDWAAVISGLTPAWLYRALLVFASVLLYYLSLRLIAVELRPFLASDTPQAMSRLRRMTLIPFLAAIATAALAGAFNPSGWTTLLTAGIPSAASAFGLTQMDHFVSRQVPTAPAVAGVITRSFSWIFAAGAVLILFVALLGPGIKFGPHP